MLRYISRRIRSAMALTTSAPSCDGSTWTRNGRLPNGVSTTRTIARATSAGSASAGSRLASPFSALSVMQLSPRLRVVIDWMAQQFKSMVTP